MKKIDEMVYELYNLTKEDIEGYLRLWKEIKFRNKIHTWVYIVNIWINN